MDIAATTMLTGTGAGCGPGGYRGARSGQDKAGPGQELSEEDQRKVERLKQRDREVRAHEAAHMAAAGGNARGGAHFDYEKGPDGRSYAVGGEVSIDTSTVSGDPEATLAKAQAIRQAALAPADPSGQDRQVAAEAVAMAAQARQEISQRAADGSPESDAARNTDTRRASNEPPAADALMQRIRANGALHGAGGGAALHLVA